MMRKESIVLNMACYKISRCFLNQVNQLCIKGFSDPGKDITHPKNVSNCRIDSTPKCP